MRKNTNLSQEMLAGRLGVTFQAVSRWEREESYPDITLLPAIANFFGVTVDFLLGTEEEKEAEEVKYIVGQCNECETHYKGEEMCRIIEEGLKKYPGNFTLMAWYVYAFQRVNSEKAIEVGQYVLDNCTDNEIRNWVSGSIIYAYKHSGQIEKATELAKKLPSYYNSSQDVLRACLEGKELLTYVQGINYLKNQHINVIFQLTICAGASQISLDDRIFVFVAKMLRNGGARMEVIMNRSSEIKVFDTNKNLEVIKVENVRNVSSDIEMLLPMWKNYMIEIGEKETDEDLFNGLVSRINIASKNKHIYFDMILNGSDVIGFAFYSIDGGIKGVIPPGYGYIMEFYVEESYRRRSIGNGLVEHICKSLDEEGCEKIYLTSVLDSEKFWGNCGFIKTELLDPDNGLNIWIRNI